MNILFFLLLLLVGYKTYETPHEIVIGKVIKKDFIPEHSEVGFLFIPGNKGKINRLPYTVKVPNNYYIITQKGRIIYKVYLNKSRWDNYEIGDNYPSLDKP